jgi:methionyl-tRNA formyltransferase
VRLIFAGTPEFAVHALEALHAAGHEIVAVYTQPDRPAGRGQKLTPSPVAQRAQALGLTLCKPPTLRDDAAQAALRVLAPEIMVVVAYGLILPQAVLDIPAHGCLNIHASLLPRWRGAAPIQRAIEAGDAQSGVTIMRREAGLDTGPMLLSEAVAISESTTAAQLHDQLAALGARLIVVALERLAHGTLAEQRQPEDGVTYARKLDKAEARIDWTQPAAAIARRIRAFNPVPAAWTELDGERLRLLLARSTGATTDAAPGTVARAEGGALQVATGDGLLQIEQLQWAGGRVLSAAQALQGRSLAGVRFA